MAKQQNTFLKSISKYFPFIKMEAEGARAPMQVKRDEKRLAWQMKRNRRFKAELKMELWRSAILTAEDPIRPRRLFLLELYKEVLRDYHLLSQVRNRIMKVTGSPFALFPVGGDEPDWETTRLLETSWFRNYQKFVLESIYWGHSLIEFGDLVKARPTVPGQFEFSTVSLIDREHVVPEQGLFLAEPHDEKGIPFREEPFKSSLWIMEAGEPTDLGLLLPAVREVIWKYYSRTDWSQHSEKFGMPLLAIATAGMNDKEIDKLEEMAANFGSNGYVIMDDLENVDMKESAKTDAYKIYLELCKYCDQQNSKGINGSTAMTDEQAYVGSVQAQERQTNELIEDDMRFITNHINEKLLPFMMERGMPVNGLEFRFIKLDNQDETDGTADPAAAPAPAKAPQKKKP